MTQPHLRIMRTRSSNLNPLEDVRRNFKIIHKCMVGARQGEKMLPPQV